MKCWNDYCDEAHDISRSKGWWEQDRNDGEMLALMHSELSELHKAFFDEKARLCQPRPSAKVPVLNEAEEELSDLAIRLFDYCAARGVDLDRAYTSAKASKPPIHKGNHALAISDLHLAVSEVLELLRKQESTDAAVGVLFFKLWGYCVLFGFEFRRAIDAKMAFNSTRPHKHGGKLF